MPTVREILTHKGEVGVQALKQDVSKISASHQTEESIHFIVVSEPFIDTLTIWGRKYFSTIETGRGPRKSDTEGNFKSNMLQYMKERGIGQDLTEKQQQNLARFLVLKINREGDKTFKKGGRVVYTPTLNKLVIEIKKETATSITKAYSKTIVNGFKHT